MSPENTPSTPDQVKNSLTKPTKYSNWLIGILGAMCIALAASSMSKTSVIHSLKQTAQAAKTAANQESYEKGYLQAIWDAYFEQPRYVIDDTKTEAILWKQMPMDEEVKSRIANFKAEIAQEMEEGPKQN